MNKQLTIKYILFGVLFLFASCERGEPQIVDAEKQNFLVYNEEVTLSPVLVDAGFVVLTKKENAQILNKIGFDGNKIWSTDITSVFNFTTRLKILKTKMFETNDKGFLIALAHIDSVKYGNLRQYVKYVKIDQEGNVLSNFDKMIINGSLGEDDYSDKFSYFDTYENTNGEIVSVTKNYTLDSFNEIYYANLQISKYSVNGDFISNTVVEFDAVYQFWKILNFDGNTMFVIADSDEYIEGIYIPIIYEFTLDGLVLSSNRLRINGFLTNSFVKGDNFILCTNSATTRGNELIEIDKQGTILSRLNLSKANKQFLMYNSIIHNDIPYLVGLTTTNILEISRPTMAWGKLENSEFVYLGELKSIEETVGLALTINSDASISILGKKKSFGVDNMILIKTGTDGIIESN